MVRPSTAPKSNGADRRAGKLKHPRAADLQLSSGIKKKKTKTKAISLRGPGVVGPAGERGQEEEGNAEVQRRPPHRKPETLLKWGHRREVRKSTTTILPLQLIRRLFHEVVCDSFPGIRVAVSKSALQLCASAGDALGSKLSAQARTYSQACKRHYTTGRDVQRAINFLSIA